MTLNLEQVLDRPIAYHRVFVTLTGSVTAAVFLSQAVYWQKRAKQPDGWFYKTAAEWEEETGLTRHEQETARKRCKKYLKSILRGIPATLFWRVDLPALYHALEFELPGGVPRVTPAENRKTSLPESGKLADRKAANFNKVSETTPENTYRERRRRGGNSKKSRPSLGDV